MLIEVFIISQRQNCKNLYFFQTLQNLSRNIQNIFFNNITEKSNELLMIHLCTSILLTREILIYGQSYFVK